MRYVIVDLEATCWEKGTRPERMEIIEIGAVRLGSDLGSPEGEFARFVRPVKEPTLSEFCIQLTGISQTQVDSSESFPAVLAEFLKWAGRTPYVWCSWGAYDLGQIRVDCRRHGMELPDSFEHHVNLKKEFARLRGIRPCGMKRALSLMGLSLEGSHHRAIDDARNIARLAQQILPVLEDEGLLLG